MDQQTVGSSPPPLPPPRTCPGSWRYNRRVCVLASKFPVQLDWIHQTQLDSTKNWAFQNLPAITEASKSPTFSFWSFNSPQQKASHSIVMPDFVHSKMPIFFAPLHLRNQDASYIRGPEEKALSLFPSQHVFLGFFSSCLS